MRGFPALRSAAAACPHTLLRGDAPNLARILLGEPEGLAIRPGGDALRSALGCRDAKKSGEAATGCDAPDGVAIEFCEPQVAIRPGGDAERPAASRRPTGRWQGELGDTARRGDAPDLVPTPIQLREPEVAIGPGGDASKPTAKRGGPTGRWQGELGDTACRGDAPDLVPKVFGEPQIAIRPGRDADGEATLRGDGELSDEARGSDAPDVVRTDFGEPEVAIRPGGDALSPAIGRGDGESGEAAPGGDAPDVVRTVSGEPEVAIGPGRDAGRPAIGCGDGEHGESATGRDAPDVALAIRDLREPEVAIRPGGDTYRRALRRNGELLDGARFGRPGGETAQAQQTDAGNDGSEKCGQVRPPSRTIHVSSSFVYGATHNFHASVSSSS